MNKKTKVLFFGSTTRSLIVLKALLIGSCYQIVGVVTQPPRPKGSEKILTPTPTAKFCQIHNLPFFTPFSLSNFRHPKSNLILVADYALKLPLSILKIPQLGALNLHPSFLPEYRGSSPAQWAIYEGKKESGVTLIKMTGEFDLGPIIARKRIPILITDTAVTLYDRCFTQGSQMLMRILPHWIRHQTNKSYRLPSPIEEFEFFLPPKTQPRISPTRYARKLTREDGLIDWGKKDNQIEYQVRAFYPWPGAWTSLEELCRVLGRTLKTNKETKRKKVKILKVHLSPHRDLIIERLQVEGKKPNSLKEFLNGYTEKTQNSNLKIQNSHKKIGLI